MDQGLAVAKGQVVLFTRTAAGAAAVTMTATVTSTTTATAAGAVGWAGVVTMVEAEAVVTEDGGGAAVTGAAGAAGARVAVSGPAGPTGPAVAAGTLRHVDVHVVG